MAKSKEIDIEALAGQIEEADSAPETVDSVVQRYAKMISEASAEEKTKLVLEMQEKVQEIEHPKSNLQIFAASRAANQLEVAEKQNLSPQVKGRWVTNRPDISSRRRFEGYSPVKDASGQEVHVGDAVLMAMPRRKYEETIQKPLKARKQYRKEAISGQFHAAGKQLGVETFGDIKYDQPKGG